jgi:hypothetical protein
MAFRPAGRIAQRATPVQAPRCRAARGWIFATPSTRRIVFMDEYAHNEAKGLWLSHGAVTMHKRFGKTSHDFYEREWVHVPRSAFISLEEQRLGPRGGDQRGGGGVLLRAKGGGAGRGDGN